MSQPQPGRHQAAACVRACVRFFFLSFLIESARRWRPRWVLCGAEHGRLAAAPGLCTMMASVAAAGAWSQAVLQTGGGRPSGGGRPPSCWHHCERCVGTMRPLCGVRAPSDREGEGGRGPQTLY